MSQKDQEAALDEKIERIRKRNEEIERRRKEVEADRQIAEKLNATVKFTPSETNPLERQPISRPPVTNRNPRFEKKVPEKSYSPNPKPPPHVKKITNFSDKDGPPPDPVYTFLTDHTRDQPRGDYSPNAGKASRENVSGGEFRGQHGRGRGRGAWNRGRGSPMRGGRRGGSGGNQFSMQGPQQPPEYQAWRAEREKIDQDRITRQRTAEGNWRREWDSEKLSQDENQEYQSRPAFSKKKKRDGEDFKIQRTVTNDLAKSPLPSKENEMRPSDKPVKTVYYAKGASEDKKTVAFNFSEGASCNDINDDDLEEDLGFEHRYISSCGDSIKISVSNKPIKSVKVNPVNPPGTGRVGPRQKPRLSYSSQSEDEKEVHASVFHKRPPPMTSHHILPQRDGGSSKKPPLPPGRGPGHEVSSPKKKPSAVKSQTPVRGMRGDESPVVEKKELSRESSHENISEGGDDSWEDVATTSGNESADYSDADMAKKSDSSDNSIPRGQVGNDGYKEEASDLKGDRIEKSDDFNGKEEQGDEEFYEEADGYQDEMDGEAERLQDEENAEATEEGFRHDVHESQEKDGDSSTEAAGRVCPSVGKEECDGKKDPVSEVEKDGSNQLGVEKEDGEDEEKATAGVLESHGDISGQMATGDSMADSKEPILDKKPDSINDLTIDSSIEQPSLSATSTTVVSGEKGSESQDSETLECSLKTSEEATVVRSVEETNPKPLQSEDPSPGSGK